MEHSIRTPWLITMALQLTVGPTNDHEKSSLRKQHLELGNERCRIVWGDPSAHCSQRELEQSSCPKANPARSGTSYRQVSAGHHQGMGISVIEYESLSDQPTRDPSRVMKLSSTRQTMTHGHRKAETVATDRVIRIQLAAWSTFPAEFDFSSSSLLNGWHTN
jgi:hypothetical protein